MAEPGWGGLATGVEDPASQLLNKQYAEDSASLCCGAIYHRLFKF